MDRNVVNSSMIKSIGYDKENSIMEVEFARGQIYKYSDVPSSIYYDVMQSDSVGKEFNRLVKGSFQFEKVE